MADNKNRGRDGQDVSLEDIVEVGSRVSWGAILAGAVMAMAVCFVLSLLGAAIGLTVSDNADGETLGTGAAIWAVATTVIGLFVGGWITSQCVVGETKTESVVHGIIMWGVFLAMLLYLTASGISAGFSSTMQMAQVAGNTSESTWQDMAQRAGISQEQIDQMASQASSEAQDPANQERAQETATEAAWWTLGGTVLSMIAAIAGALVGAGPTFRLLPIHVVHRRMERSSVAG